jgi:integrase
LKINTIVDDIQAIVDSKADKEFTPKSILIEYLSGDKTTQVVPFMEGYIKSNPDNLSWGTLKNYTKVKNCISQYNLNLDIKHLDLDWIKKYEKYLIESGKATNTIHDRMKILKRICNVAIEHGVIKSYPFKYYKSKREETKREFLTIEELNRIEDYNPTTNSESLCKDIFLFSCYTGLRFSDISTLTQKNLILDNGRTIIDVRMHKTNTLIQFPIPKKAAELPIKYNNGRWLFPLLSHDLDEDNQAKLKSSISSKNAYFNKVLKHIVSGCNIDKSISFHCARHTFATIGLKLGIRIEVLQKLLGHKNIRETQIYAKIVDEQKHSAMELWDNM